MLKKIFGIDSSFTNIMGKFADIILVSILWIVCSLPLVTLVTSTSALYYAIVKGIRKERGTPTKEFLRFFRENWKGGLGLGIVYILLTVLVMANFRAVFQMDRGTLIYEIYHVEALWVVLMFAFLSVFLFPVFSRFEYRTWECIKTSMFIAIRHTISSLLMAVVSIGVLFITARYLILILFLPAFMFLLFSFRIEKIFRKYMQEPKEGEMLPWYWDDCKTFVQYDEEKEEYKK